MKNGWAAVTVLAWAIYVNQGNGWVVVNRFESERDCAAFAKPYAEARQIQAGCAIEPTTFKLHIWPREAPTWSKRTQEFTSYGDCNAAAWREKQKGNGAACDTQ